MDNLTPTPEQSITTQTDPVLSHFRKPGQGDNKVDNRKLRKGIPQVAPETIRKIKRLSASGLSINAISKQVDACRPTIATIIKNPIIHEQIETIKARLADKAAKLAEDSIDAINPDELLDASIVQKATVFGIAVDKYNDLTDNNALDVGDFNVLKGLKDDAILDFVSSGNTVKIGIIIEPKKENEIDQNPPTVVINTHEKAIDAL